VRSCTSKYIISLLMRTNQYINLMFNCYLNLANKGVHSMKKEQFRVVIAGGRKFSDFELLTKTLDSLLRIKKDTHTIVIVSGKATGADKLGEQYAKLCGYDVDCYPADWKNLDVKPCLIRENIYGKYNALAGNNRNELMAKNSDATVAFWDGVSTGTKDMIELTKKYDSLLSVVKYMT